MAFARKEPYWRRRRLDRAIATGASRWNRRRSSSVSASRFPLGDRETSAECRGESGGDRAARGAALERTETGRKRTRSKGRSTDDRACSRQRRTEKRNYRTPASGREAPS